MLQRIPRFPYETLCDNSGDCEDTAILSATILQEMEYDVVLLELPEHMALWIKCGPDQKGKSFEYEGRNYYYGKVFTAKYDQSSKKEKRWILYTL